MLNGSRQIDQVIKGEWTTLKPCRKAVCPGHLPARRGHQGQQRQRFVFTGQVLFSDSKAVYQLSGKGVVEHPRSAFAELEAEGEKIVDGRTYTVAYAKRRGVATNAQAANVARRAPSSKGHGASM